MQQITLLPLSSIDAGAIPRDRAALEPEALALLQRSILAEGLRQPVEVFPIEGPIPFALISGFRRLSVFAALAAAGVKVLLDSQEERRRISSPPHR